MALVRHSKGFEVYSIGKAAYCIGIVMLWSCFAFQGSARAWKPNAVVVQCIGKARRGNASAKRSTLE